MASRDIKIGIQIESYWSQMGQICDFFRPDSVHFGIGAPPHRKNPIFVPFWEIWPNLDVKFDTPDGKMSRDVTSNQGCPIGPALDLIGSE